MTTFTELPILPFVSSSKVFRLGGFLNSTEKIGRLYEAIAINLPQICCINEAVTIKLAQLLLNNEDTSKRLPHITFLGIIQVTSRKCPRFACHYILLVPHSPRLVPQACLSCLRQLETLHIKPILPHFIEMFCLAKHFNVLIKL